MRLFLTAFFANFAATVLGVLIGLPLAMWTNRKIAAHGESQRRANEESRLAHALEVVARALSHNRDRFEFLAGVLAETHATFDPALDSSAWEATKGEIAPLLRDSELQHRLAYHFARVQSLCDLHKDYLGYFVGVSATVSGAEAAKSRLRDVLTNMQSELDVDAEQLVMRLEAAQARLATDTPSVVQVPLHRAPAPTSRFRALS